MIRFLARPGAGHLMALQPHPNCSAQHVDKFLTPRFLLSLPLGLAAMKLVIFASYQNPTFTFSLSKRVTISGG